MSITNPDGAIILNSITKSSKWSSLTARQISIKEKCMESLQSIINITNPPKILQKHGEGSSTTRSTNVEATGAIVISDIVESDHEITSANLWTKCGGISLS